MSRASTVGATLLAGVALACSHVAPAPPERSRGVAPTGEPRPFAALYRLSCCRQNELLVTARGDGERLSVSVAAGPAGTVVEVWLEGEMAWLRNGGERCVRSLPPNTLPLAGGAVLPLDPRLAALLLGGTVPADAQPSRQDSGWLVATARGVTASWLVAGDVVTRVAVTRTGESAPALAATLSEHHGRVPGRLVFRSGSESGELRLVEWRSAAPPQRPAWTASPPCGER